MATGRVIGVEALVRWPHPVEGLVPPDEFVPIAERTGLIGPMTDFVLRTALAQCRQWEEAGHHLSVAVNLSARSLLDADLVDDIARALAVSGVDPSKLVLEITETSVMSDAEYAMRGPQPPLGDGAHPGDRRLRDRVLVAVVPQAPPGRRGQDRQVVRAQHARRRERRRHRPVDHRPGPQPRPAGRRRRRRDRRTPGTRCATWAATSPRATSSAARCPPTSSAPGSRR